MRRLSLFVAFVTLPAVAQSPAKIAEPNDFAWRWPLETHSAASAHLLRLTPEIYTTLHGAGLDDLAVFNAAGQRLALAPMPDWAITTEQLNEQRTQWSVKTFPTTPSTPSTTASPFQAPIKIEVESGSGTHIKVETGTTQQKPEEKKPLELTSEQLAERGPPLRLNENGRAKLLYPEIEATLSVDGGPDSAVEEVHVSWESDAAPHGYWRLSSLDDVGHRIASAQSDLGHGTALDGEDTLTAAGVPGHEFVLEAFQVDPSFHIRSIAAYTRNRTQFAFQEWTTAAPGATSKNPGEFLYSLPGPQVITRVHVVLDEPGTVTKIHLYQRARSQDDWQLAGSDDVYQLKFGSTWLESGVLALNPVRARELRLISDPPLGVAPILKFAYRPDYLVFLAQGNAPYSLYAGSAKSSTHNDRAPIDQMLRKARSEFGPNWLPPEASYGMRETAGGPEALTETKPRDWKAWLLWTLLVGAAGIVTVLALSLLRSPANGNDGK